MFIPAVLVPYRITFMVPNSVFQNIMAYRAFMLLKLDGIHDGSSHPSSPMHLSSIRFAYSVREVNPNEQVRKAPDCPAQS